VFDLDLDLVTDFVVALLIHYSFDLGGQTASELTQHWLKDYPASWVCQSVIEALYQGRYKAVSVEQILAFWQRRGQTMHHYNYEFERLVCRDFPQMHSSSPSVPVNVTRQETRHNQLLSWREPPGERQEKGAGDAAPGDSLQFELVKERREQSNSPQPLYPRDMPVVDTTVKALPTKKQMGGKVGYKNYAKTSNHNPRSSGSHNYCPIQQFTPPEDSSEFYTKLKAISQSSQDDSE